MEQNKTLAGHIAAVLTVLVWGTTFISTKILLKDFLPIEILFFRFTLGYIALLLVYPHRLKLADKKQEWQFACAGLCGVTLYFLFENIALTYSMASNVGVVVCVSPLFIAILAHFFLDGEKLKANFFIGFVAAIAGIVLISFNGSTNFKLSPLGDILAVLAAVVWAIYSIIMKKIGAYGYHSIAVTRHIFFYGLLFMIPALFIFDFKFGFERFTEPTNLFNILFLGLAASALCFATWNYAVKLLGAVTTSIYIYIVPVVTVITAVIVLHEQITLIETLGIVLTLIGLIISEGKIGFKKKAVCTLDSEETE